MLLSVETIEESLRSTFRQQVIEPGIRFPIQFLQRWSYLSRQAPRLHGAALARVEIPDIQGLLAEIAYGKCGLGNRDKIHSKLIHQVIAHSPYAESITQPVAPEFVRFFEQTVTQLCHMEQDEAVGFIVGLEAPAYDILGLLKQSLQAVGIAEAAITQSEYIVIYDAMEQRHQESEHNAMEITLKSGCKLSAIQRGGNAAIRFLIKMVGEQ